MIDYSKSIYEVLASLHGIVNGTHQCLIEHSDEEFRWLHNRVNNWYPSKVSNKMDNLLELLCHEVLRQYVEKIGDPDWREKSNDSID